MKKQLHNKQWLLYVCLSVFTLSQTLLAQTTATFSRRAMLGNEFSSRSGAKITEYNGEIYIYGGYTGTNLQDFSKYNVQTGTFTKLDHLIAAPSNPKGKNVYRVGNYIYNFDAHGTGVSRYNLTTGAWQENLVPQAAFSPESGFVIGNVIYLTATYSNDFWAYDTTTNTWTQKADYPGGTGIRGTFAFEAGGKGYFGGGRNYQTNNCNFGNTGCFINAFYEYNPVTDSWAPKATVPLALVGASAVSVNGMGYVGLGARSNNTYNEIASVAWYQYNPSTDVWTPKQNFLELSDGVSGFEDALVEATAINIGTDVYLFGGNSRKYGDVYMSKDNLYKYNTTTDVWSLVDDELGGNRKEASGVYINGKLYIGGGADGEQLTDFHAYDIATNTWEQKADIPNRFARRAAVAIGNKAYFVGGYRAQVLDAAIYTDVFYEYDTTTNVWTAKAPYPGVGRGGMIAEAHNGFIYAGFGFNGSNMSNRNDFYKYDPIANAWTQLPNATYSDYGNYATFHTSSFVIGDYLYAFRHNYTGTERLQRYSFTNNVWEVVNINVNIPIDSNVYVDSIFQHNGKAYFIFNQTPDYLSPKKLMEFNPQDNSFTYVADIPFYSDNQTIIDTPTGAFFAFGATTQAEQHIAGFLNSNQLWELILNPGISTQTGVYKPQSNLETCATTILNGQVKHVTDNEGKLLVTLKASGNGIQNICVEANSVPLTPYRTIIGTFGEHPQRALFANKSLLIKSGQISHESVARIYFTTNELAAFVNAFNTQFNANKSINDIKIISNYNYNAPELADHDPLNNLFAPSNSPTARLYNIHNTTVGDYQGGKYFEAMALNQALLHNEIYVVLMSDPMPTAAPQAQSQSFCGAATVADLTATGTSLKWYNLPTGGAVLGTNTAITTGVYYVSQTLYGSEGPRTAVNVMVTNPQVPQGQSTQAFTGNIASDVTIEDLVLTGSNVKWYASPAAVEAGTPLAAGTQLANGVTYYATQTINGCESAAFAVTVSVTLSISGNDKVQFDYYPNPVQNQLNIVSGQPVTAVVVYNMLGSKVLEQKFNATTAVIDMSSLQQGSYLVRVSTNDGQRSVLTIKK